MEEIPTTDMFRNRTTGRCESLNVISIHSTQIIRVYIMFIGPRIIVIVEE